VNFEEEKPRRERAASHPVMEWNATITITDMKFHFKNTTLLEASRNNNSRTKRSEVEEKNAFRSLVARGSQWKNDVK
jgi:hypothetical protein